MTDSATPTDSKQMDEGAAATFAGAFARIVDNMATVVQGKREVLSDALVCLIAGGHLLVEDVPGVGKTTVAKALAASFGAPLGRIQFTPDLLPADVTGVSVWNRATSTFEFRPGPIFAGLVLADEINRASPKTQSALLEAMAEQQVTIDGTTHRLPDPFMVIATQNPIEQEGTYPLPESQLDRFEMKISMGYPARDAELSILETHAVSGVVDDLGPVANVDDIVRLSRLAARVELSPALRHYLVDLADASRRHPSIQLGMSPRATLSLQRVARVRAAADGRTFVLPDDVKAVAPAVIGHRLVLQPEAVLNGTSPTQLINDIQAAVATPRDRA